MASSSSLLDQYNDVLQVVGDSIIEWSDPENKYRRMTEEEWPLTDFPTAFNISLAYLAFVFVGSAIMKLGVPAVDPYLVKFVYNVSQIMLCAYMTLEAFLVAYRNNYTLLPCNAMIRTAPALGNLLWLNYVSKIWDFWDTIFIVLGKKWRQLSFLHVYHHWSTFLLYWINSRVNYDGDVYLAILLNGFIHTVMYTYYFLCMHTKNPETGKSLPIWWKSSLTSLQLVQFVAMISQGSYLLITQCEKVNLRIVATYVIYVVTLFGLFAQFFVKSYVKKPKKSKAL